jgi:serine/threonine-protein kinase
MIATSDPRSNGPEIVGPYAIYGEIGCGGMATVHIGQLRSASGFTRLVAIKRMHPELARSPEFLAMFLEEARLSGRIQHPNVVAALDCVVREGVAILIMDYVHGVALDQALRQAAERNQPVPLSVGAAILVDALMGLHAAHEAVDQTGKNLGIVHRDVSPHNIMVGADGVARVLDFGIAKAAERARHTRTGEIKGKLGYMAPEQLYQEDIGRAADVYSLGVVLWELLTGHRLFGNGAHALIMMRIANNDVAPPRTLNPDLSPEAEAVVMKALARLPEDRFATALEFAAALEKAIEPAYPHVVCDWIRSVANERLMELSELRARVDADAPTFFDDPSAPPVVSFDRSSYEFEPPTRTRSHIANLGWRGRRRVRSAGAALVGAAVVGVGAFFALRAPGPLAPVASGSLVSRPAVLARPGPPANGGTAATLGEPVPQGTVRSPAAAPAASVRGSTEPVAPKPVEFHRPLPAGAQLRRARLSADAAAVNSAAAPAAAPSASTAAPGSDLEVIGGRE